MNSVSRNAGSATVYCREDAFGRVILACSDGPYEELRVLALWTGFKRDTLPPVPDRRGLRRQVPASVGYVRRKVIEQNPEQGQPGNAVSGQNPDTAAFMTFGGYLRARNCRRGTTQGLILHAGPPRSKDRVTRWRHFLPHTAQRAGLMRQMILQFTGVETTRIRREFVKTGRIGRLGRSLPGGNSPGEHAVHL